MLELSIGDLHKRSGDGEWQQITCSSMPASAESSDNTLIISDDAVADRVQGNNGDYSVIAFIGMYTTPAKGLDGKCDHCTSLS